MNKVRIIDYDLISAAGFGVEALWANILSQESGLRENDLKGSKLKTWIGKVEAAESYVWDTKYSPYVSRNNALAALCLDRPKLRESIARCVRTFGNERVGLIVGSSTSSIDRTEEAYRHIENGKFKPEFLQPLVNNPHAPSIFVAKYLGLEGPALTINTACSSSAKVFASAARWLEAGIVDAVLVGGVDSLCLSVLHGFHSLQLVSEEPCMPFDDKRRGINLGEAAGFALLSREDAKLKSSDFVLSGWGESSDAHHMSHPHPAGLGAQLAMEQALKVSELQAEDIDYINLHGTASQANDLIEGQLVQKSFAACPVSSTKGWMGHTLGAAGISEAVICLESLKHNVIPGSLNLQEVDEQLKHLNIVANNRNASLTHVMSNSFGFGGNNCSLVFSKKVSERCATNDAL